MADGFNYYEYVLVYVDDILTISHQPAEMMDALWKLYQLKDVSVGLPTWYLGAKVKQWHFPNDAQKVRWGLSSEQYVNDAVRNVECELVKIDQWLISRNSTPMSSGYQPELDVSALLNDDHMNC